MQIGPVLWRYCHILRHDGMDYGQYLDQITYLLFLKMSSEKSEPELVAAWSSLETTPSDQVLAVFKKVLSELASREDVVGQIFSGSRSEFASGHALAQLIGLINELRWTDLDHDVQADAFEYLLEQAAAEGKKGAGQYFTPRELMRTIVACMRPGGLTSDRLVADPAAGTGGFLIAAREWSIVNASPKANLEYWGSELVQRPRRLALMNALLHGMDATIELGDALSRPMPVEPDVILANPPFGNQGGRIPDREDFWFRTTNKQANFLQHIVLALPSSGRAAIVVPDNCLFGDIAAGLLPGLVERTNLHTVLRLPDGTFSPYTSGTRTNVLFLTAGAATGETWVYDARTRDDVGRRPLRAAELDEFVACYGEDPRGGARRSRHDSSSGRWNRFDREALHAVGLEVDRLSWRAPSTLTTSDDHLRPLKLARERVGMAILEIDRLIAQFEAAREDH